MYQLSLLILQYSAKSSMSAREQVRDPSETRLDLVCSTHVVTILKFTDYDFNWVNRKPSLKAIVFFVWYDIIWSLFFKENNFEKHVLPDTVLFKSEKIYLLLLIDSVWLLISLVKSFDQESLTKSPFFQIFFRNSLPF